MHFLHSPHFLLFRHVLYFQHILLHFLCVLHLLVVARHKLHIRANTFSAPMVQMRVQLHYTLFHYISRQQQFHIRHSQSLMGTDNVEQLLVDADNRSCGEIL